MSYSGTVEVGEWVKGEYVPPPPEPGFPGDELVTLDDGKVLPLKKTICVPWGNKKVPAGKRVKLTAKLREENETQEYLLMTAANNGCLENLRNQIDKGVNVNCRSNTGGATPLITAAIGGHMDVTRALIEAGADPELGNGHCDTPITIAALWNRMDLVRYYLEVCKIDPRQWNNSPAPVSPLDRAKEMQNEDMFNLIAKYWMEYDEKDKKKAEIKEKKKQKEDASHRQKVSREAQEARVKAGVAFTPAGA